MQIRRSSVADDREKALGFYTGKLRFARHADIPLGEDRWPRDRVGLFARRTGTDGIAEDKAASHPYGCLDRKGDRP